MYAKLFGQTTPSQIDIADIKRVYVSRQTVSNWENDKSYPDINSIVLLSEVFNTSIDNLIKGDVEFMKEEIKKEDIIKFGKLGKIYAIMFLVMIISPAPLFVFLNYMGVVIWVAITTITIYISVLVEKKKKQFNIQTYKEIVAFSEGKRLDELTKVREEAKRPYQKSFIVVGVSIFAFVVSSIIGILVILLERL